MLNQVSSGLCNDDAVLECLCLARMSVDVVTFAVFRQDHTEVITIINVVHGSAVALRLSCKPNALIHLPVS